MPRCSTKLRHLLYKIFSSVNASILTSLIACGINLNRNYYTIIIEKLRSTGALGTIEHKFANRSSKTDKN